ncbi:MAG: response regulator transcription factor [Kiritimatiellae bacterium]|jgi:DNA-binding NarL/FixJ family response regulator|nr:response regulator transcription factor [Kiritimatiellia bacterium]
MKKTRILIADDHMLMRMGLKSMLQYQTDMTVVGEAANGESAVRLAKELLPDVVIMDLMMPVLDGAEATRQILENNPETKIIILTSFGSSEDMNRALSFGAAGAQIKEAPTDSLIEAIRTVLKGKSAIASEIAHEIENMAVPISLTDRQRGILQSVARGLTNKEISVQYGLSPISVKKYLSAIFTKIGAANRTEAVTIALRKHLLKV